MSANYYQMCRNSIGRPVRITTREGRTHSGMIHRVTNSRVYLQPMGGQDNRYGGFGYPGWRRRRGYGYGGFGVGIALGAITALAFLPLFFW